MPSHGHTTWVTPQTHGSYHTLHHTRVSPRSRHCHAIDNTLTLHKCHAAKHRHTTPEPHPSHIIPKTVTLQLRHTSHTTSCHNHTTVPTFQPRSCHSNANHKTVTLLSHYRLLRLNTAWGNGRPVLWQLAAVRECLCSHDRWIEGSEERNW